MHEYLEHYLEHCFLAWKIVYTIKKPVHPITVLIFMKMAPLLFPRHQHFRALVCLCVDMEGRVDERAEQPQGQQCRTHDVTQETVRFVC